MTTYIFTYYCYRAFVNCTRGLRLNLSHLTDKLKFVTRRIDCCSPVALCLLKKMTKWYTTTNKKKFLERRRNSNGIPRPTLTLNVIILNLQFSGFIFWMQHSKGKYITKIDFPKWKIYLTQVTGDLIHYPRTLLGDRNSVYANYFMTHRSFSVILSSHIGNPSQFELVMTYGPMTNWLSKVENLLDTGDGRLNPLS